MFGSTGCDKAAASLGLIWLAYPFQYIWLHLYSAALGTCVCVFLLLISRIPKSLFSSLYHISIEAFTVPIPPHVRTRQLQSNRTFPFPLHTISLSFSLLLHPFVTRLQIHAVVIEPESEVVILDATARHISFSLSARRGRRRRRKENLGQIRERGKE